MEKLGTLYKEAEKWREIHRELPALIKLSNKPANEICHRARISTTHFHHIMKNPERIKPKHYTAILRAIIEVDNYERIKQQTDG